MPAKATGKRQVSAGEARKRNDFGKERGGRAAGKNEWRGRRIPEEKGVN